MISLAEGREIRQLSHPAMCSVNYWYHGSILDFTLIGINRVWKSYLRFVFLPQIRSSRLTYIVP